MLTLLQQHVAARRGTSSLGLARSLAEEEAAAQRKEVGALIKLLTQLTQRDMPEEDGNIFDGGAHHHQQQQQAPLDMAGVRACFSNRPFECRAHARAAMHRMLAHAVASRWRWRWSPPPSAGAP